MEYYGNGSELESPHKKVAKRSTSYSESYLRDFKWAERSSQGPQFVNCNVCSSQIKIGGRKKTALQDHSKTSKHTAAFQAWKCTPSVSSFLERSAGGLKDKVIRPPQRSLFCLRTDLRVIIDCSCETFHLGYQRRIIVRWAHRGEQFTNCIS